MQRNINENVLAAFAAANPKSWHDMENFAADLFAKAAAMPKHTLETLTRAEAGTLIKLRGLLDRIDGTELHDRIGTAMTIHAGAHYLSFIRQDFPKISLVNPLAPLTQAREVGLQVMGIKHAVMTFNDPEAALEVLGAYVIDGYDYAEELKRHAAALKKLLPETTADGFLAHMTADDLQLRPEVRRTIHGFLAHLLEGKPLPPPGASARPDLH